MQTYKPGSVHFWSVLIIYLRVCSRTHCSDLPAYSREPRLCLFRGNVGIFGLATSKVCHATLVAQSAVCFYHTISPLLPLPNPSPKIERGEYR